MSQSEPTPGALLGALAPFRAPSADRPRPLDRDWRSYRMGNLFNSMEFVWRKRADAAEEPQVPRNVSRGERIRRERVALRMRRDPAFADFTAEAQDKLIRAALTDNWEPVLPRFPRIGM